MAVDWISYLYAATITAGGIVGYLKAGKYDFFNNENEEIIDQKFL